MTSEAPLYRLALIGYWAVLDAPAYRSKGWPDPHDLTGEWNVDDRRATIAHLRRGKVFRLFMGQSSCRICGKDLGSQELTDGAWAWPEGLDHYVKVHAVRLPDDFVAAARSSDRSLPSWLASLEPELWLESGPDSAMPGAPEQERAWVVDDAVWLDWAAANTPARPAEDACSLEEAVRVCHRLSHSAWSTEVDETMGRWLLQIFVGSESIRIYLQKCSESVLEHRLISLRKPDESNLLENSQANTIAAEYDGAWGALRPLAAHPQAWFVWVKPPSGEWPTQEQVDEQLQKKQQFGWDAWHPDGGKSFIIPPADEPTWRFLLIHEREAAEEMRREAPGDGVSGPPNPVLLQRGMFARCWSAIRAFFTGLTAL